MKYKGYLLLSNLETIRAPDILREVQALWVIGTFPSVMFSSPSSTMFKHDFLYTVKALIHIFFSISDFAITHQNPEVCAFYTKIIL